MSDLTDSAADLDLSVPRHVHLVAIGGALMREDTLLQACQEYDRKLEPLCRVQRHERDDAPVRVWDLV